MSDLIQHIYHEKQEAGSMLCAQHALNNLLQSPLFSPQDLADLARRLDQLEAEQLDDEDAKGGGVRESQNYDDSGFFSIMVMEEALKVLGLRLVRWKSKEMKDYHEHPERMEGFILNHQLHWYTIRRFAISERFYNLDSMIDSPEWISPMLLGLQLREAEIQGYSIFAVIPTDEAVITGLPSCTASDIAPTLPSPRNRNTYRSSSVASSSSTPAFNGRGNTLGAAPTPTPSTSTSKAKRPPPEEGGDEEGSSSTSSSVEEMSNARSRRRVRLDEDELYETELINGAGVGGGESGLSEEDMIELAIAESLRGAKISGDEEEEEDDDVVIVEKGGAVGKEMEKEKKANVSSSGLMLPRSSVPRVVPPSTTSNPIARPRPPPPTATAPEADEDDELEAALKASMETVTAKGKGKETKATTTAAAAAVEEEDDNPSVEELRRRRLARFGG